MARDLLPAVFDLDDTCWSLNPRAAQMIGVPLEKLTEFNIRENYNLTTEEQDALLQAYATSEIFRDIVFYPGFEEMMELRRFGIEPYIKSNSFSREIAMDCKLPQVQAKLPDMPRDHILLDVVDEKTTLQKAIGAEVFAFIDDSPYNIAKSEAKHNIVPMCLLNQTPRAQQMIHQKKRAFQVKPGNMHTIYALLEHLVEHDSEFTA